VCKDLLEFNHEVECRINAESVREFQPTVALWQPWGNASQFVEDATLKGLCLRSQNRKAVATPTESGLRRVSWGSFLTQGFKANPGLELANAFSVRRCSRVSSRKF
jgi:hypothetical protein